jgi:Ca2+-binding RTX toxin-like protein
MTSSWQPGRRSRSIGGRGNDYPVGGAGNDTFVWNPGDGSDIVEGQSGTDTMLFNGANINENDRHLGQWRRVRFTRDVASIVMDLNDVENIQFNALGAADTITVNDLTGPMLPMSISTWAGNDNAADTVIANATNGDDTIKVSGDNSAVTVAGLAATVTVSSFDTNDRVVINGLAGNDTIDASSVASTVKLTLNGGDGDDFIVGSQGDDLVNGGRGNDTALLGAGNDTFVWNPGDGSDIVEGQSGSDTLLFNGANIDEKIDISANGSRVRFTTRRRHRHHGSQRCREHPVQRAGRRRHHHGQRSDRDRCHQVNLDLGINGASDGAADTVSSTPPTGNDAISSPATTAL